MHAALGALRLGANRPLGTRSQVLITDTLAVSRMMTDRTAMIAQLTISESPFRGLGFFELDRRSYQLSVGARRQIGQSADAYVAIVENILNYDNSADAGVIWGIARRF